jgi:hypothetical protein
MVEGRVTVDDVAAHFETLVREQHVGYADLIDARNAKGPGWFSADVRRAAELVRNAGGGGAVGPRAILVSSSAAFGMVRMLSVLLNPWMPLEVFRDPNRPKSGSTWSRPPIAGVSSRTV